MKISIVMDGRFDFIDGQPYSGHMGYEAFGKTFLFEDTTEVEICARAYDKEKNSGECVVGDRVSFRRFPAYKGLKSFLLCLPEILRNLRDIVKSSDGIILYVPGTIPFFLALMCMIMRKPYSIFVVADPKDQLGKYALDHFLQPIVMPIFVKMLKISALHARSAMYVTKRYLQKEYPTKNSSNEYGASDVVLPDFFFNKILRNYEDMNREIRLIYVAMFAQAYKGHDILIRTIKILADSGVHVKLDLVGDGRLLDTVKEQSKRLGVYESIIFHGAVKEKRKLLDILDGADIFVMPSRAEGLPRVLVEAMARGLPIISTSVGGIPEIVDHRFLVEPESPEALAAKITEVINNKSMLVEATEKGLLLATDFTLEKTRKIKTQFMFETFGKRV